MLKGARPVIWVSLQKAQNSQNAHQEYALLWSDEEHVQKGPGTPRHLGLTEH